jgi:hypothetical protein
LRERERKRERLTARGGPLFAYLAFAAVEEAVERQKVQHVVAKP